MKSTVLARALTVLLIVVVVDALFKFGLYRRIVWGGVGAYCKITNKTEFEKHDCAARVFYSKTLWLVIAVGLGVAAGYVFK